MIKVKSATFVATLIGAILILVNAVWIALEGKAIIISTYPATSMSELTTTWARIVFGMPPFVAGAASFLWVIVAIINLILVILLHSMSKRQQYIGVFVAIISFLCMASGGGFIIGTLLVIVGSMPKIENKPLKETFLGKILRAIRLDPAIYEGISKNTQGLREAALIIVFLNILTGFGNGLYIQCVRKMLDPALPQAGQNILLKGVLPIDIGVVGIMGTYIGIGVFKWVVFSMIMHFVLTKISFRNIKFETIANAVALAYTPIALQLFMPFILFNQPYLTGVWPLLFFFISNIWMGIALVYSIRKAADVSISQAWGIAILGGAAYYLLNSIVLTQTFQLDGIWFLIQPNALLEAILSISVILSLLLGVFSKHEG